MAAVKIERKFVFFGSWTNDQPSSSATTMRAWSTKISSSPAPPVTSSPAVPPMALSLTSTTENLDSITGKINRGEGTAGKLITERELYDRLNSMSQRLDQVMTGLQQGEGTAGQLLKDRQLYENINGTVAEMRQLVQDIRADPRKFLNVRVSLF